ncbi:hypothetical protein BJY04DRAFT_182219 [Aspergillus karnatakaensis]|uniref:uncharacterized protein n=1 Tax=Aspergillus karnatakaensis TaxID=1810916 RepID=UPI003CCD5A07
MFAWVAPLQSASPPLPESILRFLPPLSFLCAPPSPGLLFLLIWQILEEPPPLPPHGPVRRLSSQIGNFSNLEARKPTRGLQSRDYNPNPQSTTSGT